MTAPTLAKMDPKQPSESYTINVDFSNNMDIASGEDLIELNCSVTATDKNETDATSDVLDGSLSIGTGDDVGKIYIKVKGGTTDLTPYKITFKTGLTTLNEKWEKDVQMKIKEL